MSIEGTCIECGTPSEELRKGICVECAMTDPIQQAIDALLDADCCISPATTTVQEKTVEGIYKAITLLQSLKEQSREPDDLTAAYMAGVEKGKDIIRAEYSREPQKPLTNDEITDLILECSGPEDDPYFLKMKFARAIEKALGVADNKENIND